jgi:hypothetical protein
MAEGVWVQMEKPPQHAYPTAIHPLFGAPERDYYSISLTTSTGARNLETFCYETWTKQLKGVNVVLFKKNPSGQYGDPG